MKIIVDPFTRLDFEIEIQLLSEGLYLAEGFLVEKNRRESLCKAAAIQPGHPPQIQRGPLLQKLSSDIDFIWLQRVYPQPAQIKEEELLSWYEEWKDEGEEAPKILFPKMEKKAIEIWPVLKLKCRFGAFADLWMDYGPKGQIGFHDPKSVTFRDKKAETAWEKDLLETGFQAKKVDTSHYYCPMDKVASSLSFLLDIGWKIIDGQGNLVHRQSRQTVEVEEQKAHLILRGKVSFSEHEVDLKDVAGAFQRKERFLELGGGHVALLDETQLPAELADFALEAGTLRLPKSRFAMLDQKENYGRSLTEILTLAVGKKGEEEVLPSVRFEGTLHPYQTHGLQWMAALKRQDLAGLLADEMGLGKTVQVLAFLSLLQEDLPLLLVVPTSLLFHWQREWEKFLPGSALYVHSGVDRKDSLEGTRAILTSYALLRQDRELFKGCEYSCVILDEAQVIKNPESQIAEAVCSLQAKFRLALTGTPIENRAEDLWSLFRFLLPELLGDQARFRSLPAEKTKKLLSPFILRRKKELVAHELPPKMEQIVWVEMEEEQRQIYDSLLAKSRKEIGETKTNNRFQILEKILRLRQTCCHPGLIGESLAPSAKLERLMADLEEIQAQGAKALIYSQFTSMLTLIRGLIEERGWKTAYLDGSTQNREEAVRQFQEDPQTQLFLISLKAGGVGLNLTKADYVLLFDPWWNEAVERQAIDRAHRLGRKSPVVARRYIVALSIEEKMMRLKEHKAKLMGDLLEDMDEGGFSTEDLLLLLDE